MVPGVQRAVVPGAAAGEGGRSTPGAGPVHRVAILPQFACNGRCSRAAPGNAPGVVANIVSPAPAPTISIAQQLDIVGTASYEPGQALHYMVQIRAASGRTVVVHEGIHAIR